MGDGGLSSLHSRTPRTHRKTGARGKDDAGEQDKPGGVTEGGIGAV
jgi:hypothetical protein